MDLVGTVGNFVSVDTAPALAGFQKALDSVFQVHVDDSRCVDVTLVAVAEYERHPSWESFSLLFSGGGPPFPQATYCIEHTELGSFPLFLAPIHTGVDGLQYEAVFNRRRP
jgi:hypothetical protein